MRLVENQQNSHLREHHATVELQQSKTTKKKLLCTLTTRNSRHPKWILLTMNLFVLIAGKPVCLQWHCFWDEGLITNLKRLLGGTNVHWEDRFFGEQCALSTDQHGAKHLITWLGWVKKLTHWLTFFIPICFSFFCCLSSLLLSSLSPLYLTLTMMLAFCFLALSPI